MSTKLKRQEISKTRFEMTKLYHKAYEALSIQIVIEFNGILYLKILSDPPLQTAQEGAHPNQIGHSPRGKASE